LPFSFVALSSIFALSPLPDIDRESESLENNAISEAADADTFDIAVGTKAAITVNIKIFLIIIRLKPSNNK
jgi:hypothetical protein